MKRNLSRPKGKGPNIMTANKCFKNVAKLNIWG
jgi:hypothetical protein